MNAPTLKKRIFAVALAFLLASQSFAPGVTAQVLADELVGSGDPVVTMGEAPAADPDQAQADEGAPDDADAEEDADPAPGQAPVATQAQPAAQPAAEAPKAREAAAPVTRANGETDYGGLTISGGTAGVDYALESVAYPRIGRGTNEAGTQDGRSIRIYGTPSENLSMLVIKQDGTYTIRNTAGTGASVSTGIRVAPGVKADITFAGVNINAHFPMDIVTNSTQNTYDTVEVDGSDVADPTTVHLTLADGTANTLTASSFSSVVTGDPAFNTEYPGLRCGEGSVLTVDDGVRNVDTSGNPITPEHGIIPAGVTYVDRDGETVTSTGKGSDLVSSLSNLDSRSAGSLLVQGGIRSAAIGGGPLENSGVMTFNGGNITAQANDPGTNGAGCGIGGGHAGGGTTTVFNGGNITALGSYHGAGIGGGCTYNGGMSRDDKRTYPLRDALLSRHASSTIAGDITINGGFIRSKGWTHSNAFGQGCGGTNTGRTILVTGGTLLPEADAAQQDGFLDIGGQGGYVIITGGSVFCGTKNGRFKFQGNDNDGLAYGNLERTTKVSMMTVNVAPKIESMADAVGVTPDLNASLESWELLLDKFPTDPAYGAPASFLEGKLYLWLPTGTNKEHQIDANFQYYVGDTLLSSNTTLPAGSSTGGDTIAKEWESFELDPGFVEQNWSKYYDGEPLTPVDVEANPIPVGNPAGGQLNENKTLKYNFQQVDEDGAALSAAVTGTATPSDAGFYDIEVRSEQYKQNTAFSQTYWGHSATGRAVIRPVCSATTAEVEQGVTLSYTDADGNEQQKTYTAPTWAQDDNAGNFNAATNNHLVVPVDVASDVLPDGSGAMSSTKCKAPTGRLQLFIDGRKVSAAHGGVIELTRAAMDDAADTSQWVRTDADGREHSMTYFNLTRSQLEAFGLEDRSGEGNEHTVVVEYTSASEDAAPRDEDAAGDDDLAAQVLAAFRSVFSAPFTPAHNDSAYVNYYESDTGESLVQIDLATPDFRLFNENGTGYVPNGEGLADGQQAANDAKVRTDEAHERDYAVKVGDTEERRGLRDDLEVKDFRDETDDDGNVTATHDDWFPLYVLTNSIGDIEFTSSNPSVIAIEPNAFTTDRAYVENKTDYGVGAKARVVSAGRTTITATLKGTGAFSGATRSFDVYVFPDLAKKPVLAIDQNTYDTTREDGTVRPGDTLRTVVDVTNTTPDSACIDPVITVSVPTDTVFRRLVAIDPDGNETDLTDTVRDAIKDGVVTVDTLPALYGGQTYRLKMDVEVQPSLISNGSPDLGSRSTADGIYGVNKDQFEWDTRLDKDGNPVDEVSTSADPTLPDPSSPEDPKKGLEDVLGGTLEDPEPDDPDDPSGDPAKPGVPVKDVTPSSPLDDAKEPRPADPDDPDGPVRPDPDRPSPVLPGDRIVEFGDRKEPDTPKTPEDIAKEVEEQVRKRLEEDPDATEVDIPVTVERYDPDDPGKDPERIEVVVTIPIPHEDPADPDDRDDHDLVVVPSDPDTSAGDIEVSKTWANVTEGADRRANTEIVQVGDELLYTVTVTNTKAGSAYYGSVVADELPVGVEYVPGSIEVVCGDGTKAGKDDFKADYNAASRRVYIAAGHLYGGQTATVTFRCRVTADRLDYDEPQDLVNVARAFGTLPSDTVRDPEPADPDDPTVPDGPKEVVIPDGTPGPFGDENPPADPVDDERGLEEPADLELFYTVRVRKVEAADDTPAADTVATRAQLLDTLRALAAADGYDLSTDPDALDLDAAHGVTLSRTAATGAEATALTETGTSTLTATFSGANGSTVRATLTHIVWDEDSPDEDRPKPGPEGGPEFLPEERTFRASATVSEKVGEGSLSQQELFERALALAQGRGLRLPAGVQRDRFTLVRQDAEGNWEELGPDEAVDLSEPASYRFTADYSREGTAETGAMSGPVTLGYSLFTSSIPTSEEKGGTSGPVAPQDPDPEDVEVTKTSTNTTPHEDGQVHVGDLLAYEISVANTGAPSTCLYDVVVSDELPEGLEVVSGSLAMVLPGGAEREVPDSVYDPLTHSLSVYGGYLKGGETLVLRFSARVGEAAEGTDIGNHAVVSYVDPSDSTTETIFGLEPRPEPGEPARSSDFPHSRVLDPTPAAYPDDATGPVLPAEATLPSTGGGGSGTLKPLPIPARGLVRAIVPVTGDTGPLTGLAVLVAGALAATAAVVRRRRTEA